MRVSVRSACWTSSSVSRRYVAPGVCLSPKSGRRYHASAYMERPYRFQAIRVGRLFQYCGSAATSHVSRAACSPERSCGPVRGLDLAPWDGLVAPAKTPRVIIDRLYRKVASVLKRPEVLETLSAVG